MTSGGGDSKSLRHVATWSWLIRAAAGLCNCKGLFFETGRAELRVDCLVRCQDATVAIPGSLAIASPMTFLAIRTPSLGDGVCGGRRVASVSTSIIVLVMGRIFNFRGASYERG